MDINNSNIFSDSQRGNNLPLVIPAVREGIRKVGPGAKKARDQYLNLSSVPPTEYVPSSKPKNLGIQDFKQCAEYISEVLGHSGRADELTKFTITYNAYNDIARQCLSGENTLAARIDIDWQVRDIQCALASSETTPVYQSEKLVRELNNVCDVDVLKKSTMIRKNDFNQVSQSDIPKLISVLLSAKRGQNKLTRLVKGVLTVMDLFERENKEFDVDLDVSVITYSATSLIQEGGLQNRAYVYDHLVDSHEHTAFLHLMCSEYPNIITNSCRHISIPADARTVLIVSAQDISKSLKVKLQAEYAWYSLLEYCATTYCGGELLDAMIIASFLRQNRYLDTIVLPRVVSLPDLIKPTLIEPVMMELPKVEFNLNQANIVGKVLNANIFCFLKDVAVSAAQSGHEDQTTMRIIDYLVGNKTMVHCMMQDYFKFTLISAFDKVEWISCLTPELLDELCDKSIFEGFWAVGSIDKCMKNGVIESLRRGYEDNLPYYTCDEEDSYQTRGLILAGELELAGVEDYEVRPGLFCVDGATVVEDEIVHIDFDESEFKVVKLKVEEVKPKYLQCYKKTMESIKTKNITKPKKQAPVNQKINQPVLNVAKPKQPEKQKPVVNKPVFNYKTDIPKIKFMEGNWFEHAKHGSLYHGVNSNFGMEGGIARVIKDDLGSDFDYIDPQGRFSYYQLENGKRLYNVVGDGNLDTFLANFFAAYTSTSEVSACFPEIGTGIWSFNQEELWKRIGSVLIGEGHVVTSKTKLTVTGLIRKIERDEQSDEESDKDEMNKSDNEEAEELEQKNREEQEKLADEATRARSTKLVFDIINNIPDISVYRGVTLTEVINEVVGSNFNPLREGKLTKSDLDMFQKLLKTKAEEEFTKKIEAQKLIQQTKLEKEEAKYINIEDFFLSKFGTTNVKMRDILESEVEPDARWLEIGASGPHEYRIYAMKMRYVMSLGYTKAKTTILDRELVARTFPGEYDLSLLGLSHEAIGAIKSAETSKDEDEKTRYQNMCDLEFGEKSELFMKLEKRGIICGNAEILGKYHNLLRLGQSHPDKTKRFRARLEDKEWDNIEMWYDKIDAIVLKKSKSSVSSAKPDQELERALRACVAARSWLFDKQLIQQYINKMCYSIEDRDKWSGN